MEQKDKEEDGNELIQTWYTTLLCDPEKRISKTEIERLLRFAMCCWCITGSHSQN